jgi:hypothetical protein
MWLVTKLKAISYRSEASWCIGYHVAPAWRSQPLTLGPALCLCYVSFSDTQLGCHLELEHLGCLLHYHYHYHCTTTLLYII